MKKLFIFDLDGTLVDAYKAIEASLAFTLKELNYPAVLPSVVRKSIGWGDVNFVKTFVKDKDLKKALALYRGHHKTALVKYSKPAPQAKKMLSNLKRRHYKLAVATNRPTKFSLILIRHLDLDKYFDMVVCADSIDEIKPKPDILLRILKKLKIKAEEAFYVGDMTVDVCAGRNANIDTIAILGGSSSRQALKQEKPFKIISNLFDLTKLV